jgi:hypothetical protein
MFELAERKPIDGEEIQMIELFKISGIDAKGKPTEKVYNIPDRERPAVAVQYLYMVRKHGLGVAESWLAENLMGTEAYEALINLPGVTVDEIDQITNAAKAVVLGEVRPKAMPAKKAGAGSKAPAAKHTSRPKSSTGSLTPKTP